MKFVKVTEHYGYYSKRIAIDSCYWIYRIIGNKPAYVISGFKTKKLVIKECKYLEEANFN